MIFIGMLAVLMLLCLIMKEATKKEVWMEALRGVLIMGILLHCVLIITSTFCVLDHHSIIQQHSEHIECYNTKGSSFEEVQQTCMLKVLEAKAGLQWHSNRLLSLSIASTKLKP